MAVSSTHEHNGQACLYFVSTTHLLVRWTNPKSSLTIQEESFYTLSSRTNRFHNLGVIKPSFEMANCCRQNSCRGRLSAWSILLKRKWIGNTFIVARKCGLLTNCRAEYISNYCFLFFGKIKGVPFSLRIVLKMSHRTRIRTFCKIIFNGSRLNLPHV